jgi:hypothetical protein
MRTIDFLQIWRRISLSALGNRRTVHGKMFYELARALIQRILRDKILLGLVVIGIFGIFLGGMGSSEEPASASKGSPVSRPAGGPGAPAGPQSDAASLASNDPNAPADGQPVDPKLATDFLKWWLSGAFDYTPATATESHKLAFGWMLPETQAAFQSAFWTPEIAQGVQQGTVVAAFHPSTVEASAVNPDGTVVVTVSGSLVIQSTGQPVTQQILTDFLVTKNQDGMRVAGIYNRSTASAPQAPTNYIASPVAPAGSTPAGYVETAPLARQLSPIMDR